MMQTDHPNPANKDNQPLSKAAYGMLIWVFSMGTLFLMALPIIIGAMTDKLGFSEADSGRVAMFAMAGVFLVTFAGTLSVHRWNLRLSCYMGLILIAVTEFFSAFTQTLGMMNALRFFNGIGAGLVLASVNAYISGFKYSDAIFGIAFAGKFTIGALALFTFPFILGASGIKGLFLCIAVMAVAALVLMTWFLKEDPRSGSGDVDIPTWSLITNLSPTLLLLLAALLGLFIANNGLWTYYERIGVDAGLKLKLVGVCLSLSMIGGIFGGSLAAWVGRRFKRTVSIGIGFFSVAGSLVLILIVVNSFTYLASALVNTVGFGFTLPFFLGAISEADHSGRLLGFGGILVSLGTLLGPGLASTVVGGGNYGFLILCAIALLVFCFCLVLAANFVKPRPVGETA